MQTSAPLPIKRGSASTLTGTIVRSATRLAGKRRQVHADAQQGSRVLPIEPLGQCGRSFVSVEDEGQGGTIAGTTGEARESREVEPGPGRHGHASEAAPLRGHRQSGVAEPVQVSGDGSKGHPERRGKFLGGDGIPRFEEQHQGEEAVWGHTPSFSGIATRCGAYPGQAGGCVPTSCLFAELVRAHTPRSRKVPAMSADTTEAESPVAYRPGSAEYDEHRAGFQLREQHQPAHVVAARAAGDVAAAVRHAAESCMPIAVQATGHGLANPLAGEGVLVSTRRMDSVDVDPGAGTAWVGAGARWRDVIEAAARYDLAPLSGSMPGVGAVSYTLGGGIGLMARRYGLAADHVTRLERVFEMIGKKASAKTCEAIKGIITEGDEIASEYKGSEAIDAGLLATAQAVEHYEIARYGTLRNWARDLGVDEAADLLEQTLDEEKETDQLLTKLADSGINESAQAQG